MGREPEDELVQRKEGRPEEVRRTPTGRRYLVATEDALQQSAEKH